MTTGMLVPPTVQDVPTYAERAEDLGYDRFWTGELWGRDSFVALTAAAERTETLGLGTAIVNVYGRSPATLAQAADSLDRISDGRFTLGLGTSTQKTIEDLHGMAFENPPRRTHETCELTRTFLADDGRVEYSGELFEVADFPSLGADVPVYAAALGPAMRRATGRTAEGWIPHNIPFERLPEAFETIAETAEAADRDPPAIEVAPYVPSAVADDPAEAHDLIRGHVAYYVGNGEGYRRAVAASFDEADDVAEAWREGDRGAARAAVTDEMVAALGVSGTPDEAREQLEAVRDVSVVDEPIVVIPGGADADQADRTIEALSPE
jgi:alkanesulfonate monooxygenase SsuD/methylene tetrahydromethanopterin reductase-like flavin-dependent oxidoreductase (luciferase family)